MKVNKSLATFHNVGNCYNFVNKNPIFILFWNMKVVTIYYYFQILRDTYKYKVNSLGFYFTNNEWKKNKNLAYKT
jgi:hypothetical protein